MVDTSSDNLRDLLDQASLGELPPSAVRRVLVEKARSYAETSLGHLLPPDRRQATPEELAAATEALAGESPVPVLPETAWSAAIAARGGFRGDARKLLQQLKRGLKTASPEVMVPLLRGYVGVDTRAMPAFFRGLPFAVPVAVAGLVDDESDADRRHRYLDELAAIPADDVPLEARAAIWLTIWDVPSLKKDSRHLWWELGMMGEPAAVGGTLSDFAPLPLGVVAPREATTRALVRVLTRDDPWLLHNWNDENMCEAMNDPRPVGQRVWEAAFSAVVDAARLWGGAPLAIDALRGLWRDAQPGDRLRVAAALGQLGDDSGLQVLLDALRTPPVEDATFWALAQLGPKAQSAIPALEELVRAEPSLWRRLPFRVALARISPDDASWSDQLASELASDEFCEFVRSRSTEFVDGIVTADEAVFLWLRPAVLAFQHWGASGLRSAAVLEAGKKVRTLLTGELPWSTHPALAALPAALASAGL